MGERHPRRTAGKFNGQAHALQCLLANAQYDWLETEDAAQDLASIREEGPQITRRPGAIRKCGFLHTPWPTPNQVARDFRRGGRMDARDGGRNANR